MCPACWESESVIFHISHHVWIDKEQYLPIWFFSTLVQSLFRQGAPERPPEPLSPPGIWWTGADLVISSHVFHEVEHIGNWQSGIWWTGTDLIFRYSRNLVIRYSRECYWSDNWTIWLSEFADFGILIWSSPFQDPFDRQGTFWPGRQVKPYLTTSCDFRNLGADKAMLSKPSRSQNPTLTTWCYQSHRGWLLSCSISGLQKGKGCSLQCAG